MALPVSPVILPAILINRVNGDLPSPALVTVAGQAGGPAVTLVVPASRAWLALCDAARKSGRILKATSLYDSYRPRSVQEATFRTRYTTSNLGGSPDAYWNGARWWLKPGYATAAVPGTSNHGWGLAVDIGVERDGDAGAESIDNATVAWLSANAHRFGFSAELQSEQWHWRYYAGDDIPDAVIEYEEESMELDGEQKSWLYNASSVVGNMAKGADSARVMSPTGAFSVLSLAPFWARIAEEVAARLGENGNGGGSGPDLAQIRMVVREQLNLTRLAYDEDGL